MNRSARTIAAPLLAAMLFASTTQLPAAGAVTAPPVPVGRPGQEAARARALMSKLAHMKAIGELPPLLTNDSAAMVGSMFGAMLYMVAGMAEGFSGMAEGMATSMGGQTGQKPKADLKKDPDMQKLKALKTDTEAVFKRYGVDLQKGPGAAPPAQLKANGRVFLAEMLRLMDKLPKKHGEHGNSLSVSKNDMPMDLAKIRYKVVSRTRVKIAGVDKKGKKQEMEARVEDGSWRLSLGDLSKLMGGGAAGGPGIPGMGMPPPEAYPAPPSTPAPGQ